MGFCPGAVLKRDNLLLLPSSTTSAIDLYDIKTLQKVGTLCNSKSEFGMTMSIKSISNTSKFLVGYEDGSIALWDSKHSQMFCKAKLFEECVMCLDYSFEVNLGISGSPSNLLSTWHKTEDKIQKGTSLEVTNPGFNDIKIRVEIIRS